MRFIKYEYVEEPHVAEFSRATWRGEHRKGEAKYLPDWNEGTLGNRIDDLGHKEVGIAFLAKGTGNKPVRNLKLL